MNISYQLDGKDIAPAELAGKSGKVTIRFDYENHCTTTATVDGKLAASAELTFMIG